MVSGERKGALDHLQFTRLPGNLHAWLAAIEPQQLSGSRMQPLETACGERTQVRFGPKPNFLIA